jgi:chaperonin GroES
MKIRPIQNRVQVRRDPPTDVTKGGIVIPDAAKDKLTRGTVVAVGRGRMSEKGHFIETTLKVGDRVVFGKYSGSEVQSYGDEDLIFMTEDEILGVIEEE